MEYQQELSLYAQRASRGIENIEYLASHTNFLNHLEKRVLAKIERSKELRWSTHLLWLDLKRRQIDGDYDIIRDREIRIAGMNQQIKNIQQTQAIEQLKRVEETGVREPTQQQADNAIAYLKRKGKL